MLAVVRIPLAAAAAPEPTNTLTRATSVSRQFVGYAPNPLLAQALCVFGERVKRDWQVRTGAGAGWRDPILLVIQPQEGAPTNSNRISVAMYPGELLIKYQVTCHTPPSPDPRLLVSAVVEALCAEAANRSTRPRRGEVFHPAVVPWWLTEGLAQSIRGREEGLMELVRRSLAGGRPLSAREVMMLTRPSAEPGEARRQQAYCWLFVEALQAQEDGTGRLAQLLGALRPTRSRAAAFQEVYGWDAGAPAALERWWALQLASRTATMAPQNLPVRSTLDKLDLVLSTRLTTGTGSNAGERVVALTELGRYADAPWLRGILTQKAGALQTLAENAPPNLRPLVADYQEALHWLRAGQVPRFQHALRRAEAARGRWREFAEELSTYLDQAERVYGGDDLGSLFRDYFETFEQIDRFQQQRRSPISDYLDGFDK